jgi:putative transposase
MPRIPRMVRADFGQRTVYHVISRTPLDGLPFKNVEKDEPVRVIQRFSMVYAVDVGVTIFRSLRWVEVDRPMMGTL